MTDTLIAALLGALITGIAGVVAVFLAGRVGKRQAKLDLRYRMAERVFERRLEAYGEMVSAIQRIAFEYEAARGIYVPGEHGEKNFEAIRRRRRATKEFLEVYYRVRALLVPGCEAILGDLFREFSIYTGYASMREDHFVSLLDEIVIGWDDPFRIRGKNRIRLDTEEEYIAGIEEGLRNGEIAPDDLSPNWRENYVPQWLGDYSSDEFLDRMDAEMRKHIASVENGTTEG